MSKSVRRAPAVLYPVGRSRFLGVCLLGLGLLGATVLLVWVLLGTRAETLGSVGVAASVWLVAIGGAFHFWRYQVQGFLRWDGQSWSLTGWPPEVESTALAAAPLVFLDLQTHLWVQVSPAGHRSIWLWLDRSSQPERWMDLRRAVYSRAKPGVDPDATAPASSRGA